MGHTILPYPVSWFPVVTTVLEITVLEISVKAPVCLILKGAVTLNGETRVEVGAEAISLVSNPRL